MVLSSILLLLLSNAVSVRRDKSILYSRESIIILLYSSIIAINSLDVTCLSKSLMLFNGLFYTSPITHTFHIVIFFISALIIQLTAFHPRKVWNTDYSDIRSILLSKFHYYNTNITNKMGQQYKIIEYPLILLFIITGGAFLICSADIVSVFLSIELQSYGLYLLCTLYRNSELSTSAGLTYFLLGGLSSCFILLGSSLLYVYYGTTSLDAYYIINNISNYSYDYYNIDVYKPLYLNTSILILLIGFLFKVSAAPFHFWSPDVYDAIPTTVTTFVAIIAKISILVFLFALIQYTAKLDMSYDFNWKYGILFSSFFSLIIGTVLGITQSRIKRLLAYSTISHLGFILLSISISSLDSIQAFIFYLIQYSFSNLNAFLILIAMGYSLYSYIYEGSDKVKVNSLSDKNNSPIQLISQLKGYFHNNVVLALSFAITLFSFVGVPPLLGFFAKQMVLSTALNNGYIYLSIIGIMTSVISAVYYLMIIKQMFFENSEHKLSKDFQNMKYKGLLINEKRKTVTFGINNIKITSFLSITISILTLTLILFILEPSNLLNAVLILGLLTINI